MVVYVGNSPLNHLISGWRNIIIRPELCHHAKFSFVSRLRIEFFSLAGEASSATTGETEKHQQHILTGVIRQLLPLTKNWDLRIHLGSLGITRIQLDLSPRFGIHLGSTPGELRQTSQASSCPACNIIALASHVPVVFHLLKNMLLFFFPCWL